MSDLVGHTMIGLLCPALVALDYAEDRAAMQVELTKLAFALAAYRADHGVYPAKLAELVPKYTEGGP